LDFAGQRGPYFWVAIILGWLQNDCTIIQQSFSQRGSLIGDEKVIEVTSLVYSLIHVNKANYDNIVVFTENIFQFTPENVVQLTAKNLPHNLKKRHIKYSRFFV